jgi:myo-inositol-1(or 4)-monophosphatase
MSRSTPDIAALLACAVEATHCAGAHALKQSARRTEIVRTDRHDVKLRLDVECQAKAEAVIRARFPDHAILGEEDQNHDDATLAGQGYLWIIDPIDGTVNFSHGLPLWCCSIAVRKGGETQAGSVFAPALNENYTATVNGPALCNGSALRVSTVDRLSATMVFTGVDKNPGEGIPEFALFEAISSNVQKTRVLGCAALDLCRVAAGHGEAYFESGVYDWDVAAAELIVRRAGGRTELLRRQRRHRISFLATNGLIHDALRSVVAPLIPAG